MVIYHATVLNHFFSVIFSRKLRLVHKKNVSMADILTFFSNIIFLFLTVFRRSFGSILGSFGWEVSVFGWILSHIKLFF